MDKKAVFITGSTRGIGKSMALEFAKNGYAVVLNGTNKSDASEKTLAEVKKFAPESQIFYFDVSDPKLVESGCRKILSEFGQIDVLVNNAGIVRDRSLLKLSLEDWDIVIKTDLYGPFYIIKQFLPSMVEKGSGRIINISSIIGQIGNFGQTNYSAAKAGLIGLTKSLAKETARFKVTVNAICPGFTETDMVAGVSDEIMQAKVLPKIALGRLAKPEEIAKLALFLASDDSGYITGECIGINGGWL